MNNTFHWNRFCEVVKKDFRNMWPLFGRTMLILALLPMTIWLVSVVFPGVSPVSANFRLWAVKLVAMLAACMTASRMYRTWNLVGEGIYYAMLPASKLEKLLSASFFSIIVCPLLVFFGSIVVDTFLTMLPFGGYREWIWQRDPGLFSFNLDTDPGFHYGPWGTLYSITYLLSFVGTTLLFMFTSTLFKRHKVLRTFLWIYLIEFVITLVLVPMLNTPSFTVWFIGLFKDMGPDGVLNLFFGGMIAFAVIEIIVFGWLTWRRLDRMGY